MGGRQWRGGLELAVLRGRGAHVPHDAGVQGLRAGGVPADRRGGDRPPPFDLTDGWGGVPAAGEHVFVVTHAPPTDWKRAGTAPFTFVTEGVEAAIVQAREFAGPDRDVDVAAGQIGGQALRLGLIDQVVMNVVPVVFGEGRAPGQRLDLLGDGSAELSP
jgi:hypothetical protein